MKDTRELLSSLLEKKKKNRFHHSFHIERNKAFGSLSAQDMILILASAVVTAQPDSAIRHLNACVYKSV